MKVTKPGDVNAYICKDCGYLTVIVHKDPGVTPMFLGCRGPIECNGMAVSMMYNIPKQMLPEPKFEWYNPGNAELSRMDIGMQDHVRRGGLVLREISLDSLQAFRSRS